MAGHRTWHGWFGSHREVTASTSRIIDHLYEELRDYGCNKVEVRSLLCSVFSDQDFIFDLVEVARKIIDNFPEGTREG